MTTRRTLSEIRATCTKAARGAGCPWGLAEEAGMAARRLQSYGFPASETLATLFEIPRACGCDGTGQAKCGIALAAALSDHLHEQTISHPVAAPALLLAPLLQDATDGTTWQLDWGDGRAICSPDGLYMTGSPPPKIASTIAITRTSQPETVNRSDWRSQPVDEGAWNTLLGLAAKTYVPETEQSRAAGAGPADSQED